MGRRSGICICLAAFVQLLVFVQVEANSSTDARFSPPHGGTEKTESAERIGFESALGDPGMKDQRVRVAIEGWNFCNNAGRGGSSLPSPRQADCADLKCSSKMGEMGTCSVLQHVTPEDNLLKAGEPFIEGTFRNIEDPDDYAVEKELYLASLCQVQASPSDKPWHFWMIMLKNGNLDVDSGLCPSTAPRSKHSRPLNRGYFPCFGKGCMNQPLIYHNWSTPRPAPCSSTSRRTCATDEQQSLTGMFYGTYDLDAVPNENSKHLSYFSVTWEKNPQTGSWIFHHVLKVTGKYPWLMLYLRADAIKGPSGGYPHDTRGMMKMVPESPNFKVVLTLNVTRGGGRASQFYLLDIGGCWKNDGQPCDGNRATDVTRYSEMIINPKTRNACQASAIALCPPYHVAIDGRIIHRNDTKGFPYAAYHFYCVPPNALMAEKPHAVCDPYSNPQPQELMQLLPHPEWAVHGYPARKGEGWVGDPRTWTLDVGGLSSRLYFYQDPETPPAKRVWASIDVGTEIFNSRKEDVARWSVSDFDVLISNQKKGA